MSCERPHVLTEFPRNRHHPGFGPERQIKTRAVGFLVGRHGICLSFALISFSHINSDEPHGTFKA
jgi:hypothetical protein